MSVKNNHLIQDTISLVNSRYVQTLVDIEAIQFELIQALASAKVSRWHDFLPAHTPIIMGQIVEQLTTLSMNGTINICFEKNGEGFTFNIYLSHYSPFSTYDTLFRKAIITVNGKQRPLQDAVETFLKGTLSIRHASFMGTVIIITFPPTRHTAVSATRRPHQAAASFK